MTAKAKDGGRAAARGSVSYAMAGIVDRLACFAAIPLITHSISVEAFGWLTLVRVTLPVGHNLVEMGAGAGTVRFAAGDSEERPSVFGTLLFSRLLLASSAAALALGVGALVLPGALTEVALAVATFLGVTLADALATRLRAVGHHRRVAWSYTSGAVLELLVVAGLALAGRLTLAGVLLALAARFGLVCLALSKPALAGLGRPSFARFVRLVRFGAPVALNYLVTSLGAFDRWLVEPLTSLAGVGAYQLGSITGSVVELVERALFMAFEPYVYAGSEGDPKPVEELVCGYATLCALAVFPFVFLMPELLSILAPPSYAMAISLAPWLAAAAASQGLFRIVGLASGLAKRTGPWALAGVCELVLTLLLFLAALPAFGILAAGPARLLAAAGGALAGYAWSTRVSPFRGPVLRVLAYFAVSALLGAMMLSEAGGGIRPLWERALVLTVVVAMVIPVAGLRPIRAARWLWTLPKDAVAH